MNFEKLPDTIELFYIGDKYYFTSGTMMSSIYIIETKQRFDWGFVACALRAGKKVFIRPANNEEKQWAEQTLKEYQKRKT